MDLNSLGYWRGEVILAQTGLAKSAVRETDSVLGQPWALCTQSRIWAESYFYSLDPFTRVYAQLGPHRTVTSVGNISQCQELRGGGGVFRLGGISVSSSVGEVVRIRAPSFKQEKKDKPQTYRSCQMSKI